MAKLTKILYELFFRIKLYLFGIHFYEIKSPAVLPVDFYKTHNLGRNGTIHLKFSRVNCTDLMLVRGKLKNTDYVSYIVSATSTGRISRIVGVLNDRQFFFNSRINKFKLEEDRVVQLIADVYIDFATTFKEK